MVLTQAERITAEIFRKAVLQSNTRRKEDAARKLDFYNDEQADHLLTQIAGNYKSPERIAPVSVNLVRKIVRALSTVYLQDAVRTLDGSQQEQEIYSLIEDSASLPVKMKLANRYARLLGSILIRPVWRNGQMDLDILTPDILDVFCGDSPEDVQAVMVTLFSDTGLQTEIEYSLWTPEQVQRLDYRFSVISSEPNPYGILPFVPVFACPPTTEFWLPGANDLMLVQDAINERLTDIWHTLRFQSFGVAYIKEGDKGKHKHSRPSSTVDIGPNSLLLLPPDGEVGFAAPKAPIQDSLNAIEFLMKQTAITNGLSAASMSLNPTEQSGISRIVANTELEELRRDDIAMFAKVEQRLFHIIRTIWNIHNPQRPMREATPLRVDFFDPKPSVSATEQIKEWQGLLELGLISPVDVLIERNPDLNREDAKAKLLTIRDELKEFQFANWA
jgi:hypothetical protein